MKRIIALAVVAFASHVCFAQSAKEDMKAAGKDIGRGTKKAAKTIGRETKKAAKAVGKESKKAARAVRRSTKKGSVKQTVSVNINSHN